MKPVLATIFGLLFCQQAAASEPDLNALLDHQLKRLHSSEVVNLKSQYAGQPMLVINTASRCGFTPQFEGLEALHQTYKEKGLRVVGFPSNDFMQEAKDEAKIAKVCRYNFGVTFDMFAPIPVRGSDAHPVFREIARQTGKAPRWNFYKYVINKEGQVTAVFSSMTSPDDRELIEAIEAVL
ncbi:glutathione peroxidase [Marinobacterium sediminicola]|uniref:Glutathione peroxidase n=1 Tax=Marinobacterium sediminicola TaxID=518898 RepID=A0ABY1S388_9GAMM|nr:glutathione peroxidase [Marinobacterium sediminicola]ULG68852.1 glutathione peroxidase [Marinobacterium sediminicola]SMR77538.1 glutathione peroxidase [Marinobacterium sediminicola]